MLSQGVDYDWNSKTYTGFGDSVSVSADGEMIAVGESFNDDL